MNKIFNFAKVFALALVLSFGLSYVYAWTAPTQQPPAGNVSAPLNTSGVAQIKIGGLTVGGLTTTQDINIGTNKIIGGGTSAHFGATTVQGEQSSWAGINFKQANGTNSGTLMMHPSASGFYNAADNQWRMFVTEDSARHTAPAGLLGDVYANDYYSYAAGRWMSELGSATHGVATYTGSGTFTVQAPSIKVTAVGGGGGGGGGSNSGGQGGGGGGACVRQIGGLTVGSTVAVTVGGGGGAGYGTGGGGTGGPSLFGTYCYGYGGSGGGYYWSSAVGSGGGAANGDLNIVGGAGSAGNTGYSAGSGGSSYLGGGGKGGQGTAGSSGGSYGGGGGGGHSSGNISGGAGAAGVVYIEW